MQPCFPLFTLKHLPGCLALRKVAKEKSAVSFGDPRGFLSCTAVIWLALTTMIHQRHESISTQWINSQSSSRRSESVYVFVCTEINTSNSSIQVKGYRYIFYYGNQKTMGFSLRPMCPTCFLSQWEHAERKPLGLKKVGNDCTFCVVRFLWWIFLPMRFCLFVCSLCCGWDVCVCDLAHTRFFLCVDSETHEQERRTSAWKCSPRRMV